MIDAFLERCGWSNARRAALAGDASARRYTRLQDSTTSAILMEDPDPNNLARFLRIGAHLRDLGLSAPETLAAEPDTGLCLIEDFGDLTLSRLLVSEPDTARSAYQAAAALLPRLAAPPPPDIPAPDADGMAAMVGLTFDLLPDSDTLRARLLPALADAITRHAPGPPVLSLRDVHGDNLIWLPDRDGPARVGLLDYQDAMLLPAGYDLASLLDDPRREIPDTISAELIKDSGRHAVLSLQRNLRILGIFHRLDSQNSKRQYRAFLPRAHSLVRRASEGLPTLKGPVSDLLDRTAAWAAAP